MTHFDVDRIRADFPALHQTIHNKPLVYLDSAASSQKPQCVIDAVSQCYQDYYSNVHRGVHTLSGRATEAYENARKTLQQFINANDLSEIIFVRGTTEAINLVAQSYGRSNIKAGNEILITYMEHHANIVPWQMLCEQTGATLKVVPILESGELDLDAVEKLLNPKVKLFAFTHISNTLGTINPIQTLIDAAHAYDIPVLIDGAQGVVHSQVDVQALNCDFYTFSSHKLYGPTGIGVLYGKADLLGAMPPYQGGGDMIRQVSFEKTTYAPLPNKFEAGTPHIAGAVGFAKACDYLQQFDWNAVESHEKQLLEYALDKLNTIEKLRIIGNAKDRAGIISFIFEDIHAHDIGTLLDHGGVAVRTGHHCTMPLMQYYRVPATSRISFGLYNTQDEIDSLIQTLEKTREIFKR